MAAMTNLLLKDDATSPVEYTFIPISDTPNPVWRTAISGVPFEGQMRLQSSQETVKSGDCKFTEKLEVPVMETQGASGTSAGYVAPPKVAYVNTIIVTMFANARSTRQDRANTLKLMAGLLAGGSSTTATGTLDGASAGDAWKNSTAPGPQLFVDGIVPN
jgi:hypothetical protein